MRTYAMRVVYTIAALCFASTLHAFELSLQTSSGDTLFFASAGDTVTVELHVDSEGESLIGVEVFLSFDHRLFEPLDASPDVGLQPVLSAGGLAGVFADSVISVTDSVSVIHYAEVDLGGVALSGLFASIDFAVLGARSGRTPFSVVIDSLNDLRSQYAVLNQDGLSIDVPDPGDLVFEDTPPRFTAIPDYFIVEDHPFTLEMTALAVDDQTGAGSLTWEATTEVEGVGVEITGSLLSLTTPENFNGPVVFTLVAIDPSGARAEGAATMTVTPENDPPQIDRDALPGTLEIGSEPIAFEVFAEDVEDPVAQLTLAVLAGDPVMVTIEGGVVTVSVPGGWDGTATVSVQISDTEGAIDEAVISVLGQPIVFAVGDFNRDGAVDFGDFLLFAAAFSLPNPTYDLDGGGFVDFADLVIFASSFANG